MTNSKYNQLIPDDIIDTIHIQIKRCISEELNYDHYIKIFDTLNGGVIPQIIKDLINK